jgi:hypothetical protein
MTTSLPTTARIPRVLKVRELLEAPGLPDRDLLKAPDLPDRDLLQVLALRTVLALQNLEAQPLPLIRTISTCLHGALVIERL